jgi:hypothetical protein
MRGYRFANEDTSLAKSREVGRSQWVDATLAEGLLLRVNEADFVGGRQFKQIKALFRF